MKYSTVLLGAFLVATTLALPAPAAHSSSTADGLASRDTSVQVAKCKRIVKKAVIPTEFEADTDTDSIGDIDDSVLGRLTENL